MNNATKHTWKINGSKVTTSVLSGKCPMCGADHAIVALPPSLLAAQPDDTTHVCHPSRGGCNHGFCDTQPGHDDLPLGAA